VADDRTFTANELRFRQAILAKDAINAIEEGGRAADAAMYELMNTPPATLAGMRANIQYLVDWDNDSGYYYLPTLLRSPLLAA
jgi:hypothetical protein